MAIEQLAADRGEEVEVAQQIGDAPLAAAGDRLGAGRAQVAHHRQRVPEGGQAALHRLPRPWRSGRRNSPPGTLSASANRGRPCGLSAPDYRIRTNSTTTETLQNNHAKKRSVSLAECGTQQGSCSSGGSSSGRSVGSRAARRRNRRAAELRRRGWRERFWHRTSRPCEPVPAAGSAPARAPFLAAFEQLEAVEDGLHLG